jgi:DNA-directed RNA polymerase specialized sigma24 family protein
MSASMASDNPPSGPLSRPEPPPSGPLSRPEPAPNATASDGGRRALGDPALRRQLEEFVRRRVPASDVDDVVQTVLLDALASRARPDGGDELKRWLLGVARHKVVDLHRRAHREPPAELPDIEAAAPPVEERELVRWAEEQAGSTKDAQRTLGWMAREGEGEKLESIAADEQVPAARVRQRVSRMRRWMKERWLAELAAVAALALLAFAMWRWLSRPEDERPEAHHEPPAPTATVEPEPTPLERAAELRLKAFDECRAERWQACLDGLDRAKALDSGGDAAPAVGAARDAATRGLAPAPSESAAPPPAPSPPPTAKSAPRPKGPKESKLDVKPGGLSSFGDTPGGKSPPPDYSFPKKAAPKKPAPTSDGEDVTSHKK